jgi:hypothetical protein
MKSFILPLLLFAVAIPAVAQTKQSKSSAFQSIQLKLNQLALNGASSHPKPTTMDMTAAEANAWVNEGGVKLPAGVSNVRFTSTPGVINTDAKVDFDKLTEGKQSINPLLMFFTGVHDVTVVAHASGAGGTGQVHVHTLTIDGLNVPRTAMEFFVNRYLKPKYPAVGLDTSFRFPSRVDSAVVGTNKVTVTQK